MSWYRSYAQDSALYSLHAPTSPRQAVPAITEQQKCTAVDRQQIVLEDAELQFEGSERREDETFFSLKAFVSNGPTHPAPQTANAAPTNEYSTTESSKRSAGVAPSSEGNSGQPSIPPAANRRSSAVVGSLGAPVEALQQSHMPNSVAGDPGKGNCQLSQLMIVHDQQGPNASVTQSRPTALTTAVQVEPRLLTCNTTTASSSASQIDGFPVPPGSSTDASTVLAEVEMQHRDGASSQSENVHHRKSSSASEASESYTDPLLHWSDCWAGSGLRHRATAAGRQQTRSSTRLTVVDRRASPEFDSTAQCQQQQHPRPPQSPRAADGGRGAAAPHAMQTAAGRATAQQQSSGIRTERLQSQQQQQQQCLPLPSPRPGRQLHWWLLGGVGLAALSGCAVVAVFGVVSYMMKAAMVYSLAWKAATGVAAAEGLALGGWSVKSSRASKAASAAAAEELARVRERAVRELNALRAMLQQQGAAHGQEVSHLSKVNEKLRRLAHTLTTENAGLQTALHQAAAERKALEAAAALENSRAETSAVAAAAAAQGERVLGEVEVLASQQQQLISLVFELREDLLGLVAAGDKQAATQLFVTESAGFSSGQWCVLDQLEGTHTAAAEQSGGKEGTLLGAAVAATAAAAGEVDCPPGTASQQACPGASCSADWASGVDLRRNSTSTTAAGEGAVPAAADTDQTAAFVAEVPLRSAGSGSSVNSQVQHIKSVRGGVNAAMAAAVAHTLEL